jgi:hypothetical protein
MGEANRRCAPRQADILPDFIFGRDQEIEKASGFVLAGKLLTDIPEHSIPSESDLQLIAEIVKRLGDAVQRNPDIIEASIWRDADAKPAGAAKPPYAFAAIQEKAKRFAVVVVRVDERQSRPGVIRLDDSLIADIVGRH